MVSLLLDGGQRNTGIDHIRDSRVFEGIELQFHRETEGGTDNGTPVGCELAGADFSGAWGEVKARMITEKVVAGIG